MVYYDLFTIYCNQRFKITKLVCFKLKGNISDFKTIIDSLQDGAAANIMMFIQNTVKLKYKDRNANLLIKITTRNTDLLSLLIECQPLGHGAPCRLHLAVLCWIVLAASLTDCFLLPELCLMVDPSLCCSCISMISSSVLSFSPGSFCQC